MKTIVMAEALGLMLPGTALMPATAPELKQAAYDAGAQLMKLVEAGVTAGDIVDMRSFENAIMVHAAISGSTNALMHIPAIAHEFGFEIDADTFTAVSDKKCIPTGEMRPVGGTPFDLREPKRMGDGMALTDKDEQLTYGNGYDHNFNLNGEGLRFAVEVSEPTTGRVMQVYTDMPAVQFYAGNGLESVNPGSCGRNYHKHEGFCLETQYAPDSINHPEFPDSVLRAGEKYDFVTIFTFDAE